MGRLGSDWWFEFPIRPDAGDFLEALDAWWQSLRLPTEPLPGPFSGGWLLYLGYELSAQIEPSLDLPPCPLPVVALALRAPAAWIRDRASRQSWLVAEPGCEALLQRFEAHAREATRSEAAGRPQRNTPRTGAHRGADCRVTEEDPDLFLRAVRRSLEYIAAGEVYQANLSRQWRVSADPPLDPSAVYARLRAANPAPFAALMRYGHVSLMSSSPERLLSIRDGIVATRPIAGTRPRGASAQADADLKDSLLASDKERAEHVMLIDLERNDLGRVCVGGTVRIDEYMVLESYAHVHHIVSSVSGRLRAEASPVQAIRALFPGGTITGCPKVRCMQIIAELEGVGRGAYTGSLGYLNRDGSCDLNILIRTLTAGAQPPDSITFRAGAGVVADSDPMQELAETRAKALGMLRALGAGG